MTLVITRRGKPYRRAGNGGRFQRNADGYRSEGIEMPLAVGLVGGATKVHPTAGLAVKILGVELEDELAEIIAAAGPGADAECSSAIAWLDSSSAIR